MRRVIQNDPAGRELISGWLEVEGDIDDFVFFEENPNQSEK